MLMTRWCGAALLFLFSFPALAHKPSDSYLTLKVQGHQVTGQWDIALRDLDMAIGLDADGNGELTWDEVKARHPAIAAYALSRLTLHVKDGGAFDAAAFLRRLVVAVAVGLVDGALELSGREDGGEVEEGAVDGGDG
ncbi:MAG: hypothetical protein ACJ8HI_04265, partial [Massilia sp.]